MRLGALGNPERPRDRDRRALFEVRYPTGDEGRLAVPTPEHYLPLLYAIALQHPGEQAEFFNSTVRGAFSMTSVLIGGPAPA